MQLAKIRFALAGQITQRSHLLHFITVINMQVCVQKTHMCRYIQDYSCFNSCTILDYTPSLTLIQGVLLVQWFHKSPRMSGGYLGTWSLASGGYIITLKADSGPNSPWSAVWRGQSGHNVFFSLSTPMRQPFIYHVNTQNRIEVTDLVLSNTDHTDPLPVSRLGQGHHYT